MQSQEPETNSHPSDSLTIDLDVFDDVSKLNNLLREMHLISEEGDKLQSCFLKTVSKTTYVATIPTELVRSTDENTAVFTVDNKFHYLLYIYLSCKLPAIKLKKQFLESEQFEICWQNNIGHNIIESISQCFDDVANQTFDSKYLDIHSQFFAPSGAGKREMYRERIGDDKRLNGWSKFLPQWGIKFTLPFFNNKNVSQAIPLYKCSKYRIQYKAKFKLNLKDLIRIRARDNKDSNDWRCIKFNMKYVDTNANNGKIDLPRVWGRYANVTKYELDQSKKHKHVFYIEDVIRHTGETDKDGCADLILKSKDPVKAIFPLFQKKNDSVNLSWPSNYTTNTVDIDKGWNPLEQLSLKYGAISRIGWLDGGHFDNIESIKFFPSSPYHRGYTAISIAIDPNTSRKTSSGRIFDNELDCKLYVKVGNTDPYNIVPSTKSKDVVVEDDGRVIIPELEDSTSMQIVDQNIDRYVLYVYLLVTKKISMND